MDENLEVNKYGASGIDTEYERGKINYRPKPEYVPVIDEIIDDTYTSTELDLEEIGDVSTLPIWETVVDTIENVNELESSLSEQLKDISVPIPDRYLNMVKEAAKTFDVEITDTIPFELYKETFNQPDSSDSALIQDIFEDYQSDVEGTLNAELYPDIIEMKQDLQLLTDFVKRGLFLQFVDASQLPSKLQLDDDKVQAVKDAETKLLEEYGRSLKTNTVNEAIVLELSALEYGSDRYYQAEKEWIEGIQDTRTIERKIYTKSEVTDLIQGKLSAVTYTLGLVENTIDYVPYKDEEEEIIYHLLKQFKTKGDAEKGLLKMQALTKLSVDYKKGRTNELKSNLRGVAGITNRSKVNDNLVNGIHMKNQIIGDVYDVFDFFDGVPDSSGFDLMAEHIVDSIQQADQMYVDQSLDFYKMHGMESQLRGEKIRKVIDKDSTRSVYKIFGNVRKYINDTGKWPDEANLSAWVKDFIEQGKIY